MDEKLDSNKTDGLRILVWTFAIFFAVAGIALIVESAFDLQEKPDLAVHYWIENGRVFFKKGPI